MSYTSPWTPELVEEITKLNAAGWSAGAISNKLNCGLSRCAVIGKLSRLGLNMPRSSITTQVERPKIIRAQKSEEPVEHKPVRRIRAMNGNSNGVRFVQSVSTKLPALREVELVPLNISFEDLEPGMCRYPYGDEAPYLFCGHPKKEGYSYCWHHKHLAWRKPDPRPVKHYVETGPSRFTFQRNVVQA